MPLQGHRPTGRAQHLQCSIYLLKARLSASKASWHGGSSCFETPLHLFERNIYEGKEKNRQENISLFTALSFVNAGNEEVGSDIA